MEQRFFIHCQNCPGKSNNTFEQKWKKLFEKKRKMFSNIFFVFSATVLLLGNVGGQVFDVFGSSESEFGLEIDEVFLTDLETAPVSTHHMRPGKRFFVVNVLLCFVVDGDAVIVLLLGLVRTCC